MLRSLCVCLCVCAAVLSVCSVRCDLPSGFTDALNIVHFSAINAFGQESVGLQASQYYRDRVNGLGGIAMTTTDSVQKKWFVNVTYYDFGTATTPAQITSQCDAVTSGSLGFIPHAVVTPYGTGNAVACAVGANRNSVFTLMPTGYGDNVFQCDYSIENATDCVSRGLSQGTRRFPYGFSAGPSAADMVSPVVNFLALNQVPTVIVFYQAQPFSQSIANEAVVLSQNLNINCVPIFYPGGTTVPVATWLAILPDVIARYGNAPMLIGTPFLSPCNNLLIALKQLNHFPSLLYMSVCNQVPGFGAAGGADPTYVTTWLQFINTARGYWYQDKSRYQVPSGATYSSAQVITNDYKAYNSSFQPFFSLTGATVSMYYAVELAMVQGLVPLSSTGTLSAPLLKQGFQALFTPSFWGKMAFGQFGNIQADSQLVMQYVSPTSQVIVQPIGAAQRQVIFPAPTWDERAFNHVDWTSDDKVIIACTAVSQAYIVLLMYLTVRHWNSPAIKAATRIFLIVMLLGSLMQMSSNYAWLTYQTDSKCQAHVWLISLGFIFVWVPLGLKTLRLFRIFNSAKLTVSTFEKTMYSAFLVSILVEVVYLLGWTEGYGIEMNYIVVDPLRPSMNITHCSTSLALTWVSVGYKAAWILLLSVLSFLCRNLPAAFNETRYIANCMYNAVLCGVVVLPLMSSGSVDDNTKMYVRSFIIMGVNCAMQSILLIPKFLNPTGRGQPTETLTRSAGQSMFGAKSSRASTKSNANHSNGSKEDRRESGVSMASSSTNGNGHGNGSHETNGNGNTEDSPIKNAV